MRHWRRTAALIAAAGVAAGVLIAPGAGGAAPGATPKDSFYHYSGRAKLATLAPGTVLKTRTVSYHLTQLPTPITVVQLLYRATDAQGRATSNVTSVLLPPAPSGTPRLASYQSFYDSLDPADEPSHVIAGDGDLSGGGLATAETGLIAPLLLAGYTVTVADTEGQTADFAAGPEYGTNTLDSIRAAYNSPLTGVPAGTPTALLGYSGGAIATEWAAELAPTYAPDVDADLVGASMGGVLVDPAHNLHYIDGTPVWSGVLPMALIGIARAYGVDLRPYLSPYGRQVFRQLRRAGIGDALAHYPGLTFAQLAKRRYATPESIPAYVTLANKLIMGTGGTPSVPLFVGQGAGGEAEGTPGDKPGIGPGDGVMIAGDVRTLVRQYCAAGVPVEYQQYDATSHVTSAAAWAAGTYPWLAARFAGTAAPRNCDSVAPGNPLIPIPTS